MNICFTDDDGCCLRRLFPFLSFFYLRWIWALTAFQSNSNKNVLLQVWLGQEKMNEWMKSNKTQTIRREWERERERERDNPIIKRAEGKYTQWLVTVLCNYHLSEVLVFIC